jgi:hypothetical protein
MKQELAKLSISKTVAPEDVHAGDYVMLMHVVWEESGIRLRRQSGRITRGQGQGPGCCNNLMECSHPRIESWKVREC